MSDSKLDRNYNRQAQQKSKGVNGGIELGTDMYI